MLNVNRFRLHNFRRGYLPKLISQAASVIAIAIGRLVLIGWQLDNAVLKSASFGNMPVMKVNTALCFILSGVSLWLAQQGKRRNEKSSFTYRISRLCAVAVVVISLLTLSQYLFNWNLGIDQLLFRDLSQSVLSPGRMAFNTAFSFVLVGSALLILSQQTSRSYWYAQILAIIVAVLSLQALIGYAYKVEVLYKIAPYTTAIAIHTAVTFLVVCIGLLWAHPDQGLMRIVTSDRPAGSLARRLLIAAIAVPLGLGWLIVQGQRSGYYDPAFAISLCFYT